jgi:putative phosphoribosyl transferase
MVQRFADRAAAGQALAGRLAGVVPPLELVLALPRGGVAVAAPIARALHLPLDLLLVRKITSPVFPELAVAAVAEGPPPCLEFDEPGMACTGMTREAIQAQVPAELAELARRRECYLGGQAARNVHGRSVVLVDDGIATGATVRAALRSLRVRRPAHVVLAVPVAPRETLERLRVEVDEIVCLATPEPFSAVGAYYRHFDQLDDEAVVACLRQAGDAA